MDVNSLDQSWKADVEKDNTTSTKPPQIILDLPTPNVNRIDLTESQVQDAKKDLLKKDFIKLKYPREQKFRVDPNIPGQHIGLISFTPSKNAIPDSDGCFGVLKFRGAFPSSNEAETYAEKLLREYDTYADIDLVFIGKEFPVMVDNTIYTKSTREIDIRKKVDDMVKADLRTKKDKEQKDIEDVMQRQQKLLDKTHAEEKEETYNDIDYYTTLRVKKAQALSLIDDAGKRVKEAEGVVASADTEINKLDDEFPQYKMDFMAKYEKALASIGSKLTDNPLVNYLK